MELEQIQQIVELMAQNGLTEFELQKDAFKIRIAKGALVAPQHAFLPPSAVSAIPPSASSPAETATWPAITSPMVGTFYKAPAPDARPFVSVGDEVKEDTVVCIIEAMKVMNEIKAEVNGVIRKVIAENGKPVEFGQPLFEIEPR